MTMTEAHPFAPAQPTQDDVDAAWRAEIRRRIDDPNIQWLSEEEADADIAAFLAQ